jgi:GT2 family glycosyltransferase
MTPVTAIIVSWNCRRQLQDCLLSLSACMVRYPISVIVVDNSSVDGTELMIKEAFPQVKCIQAGKNLGFSKANNIGVQYCKSSYILFLNPDTIVNEEAIVVMADQLDSHPDIGIVGCKTVRANGMINEIGLQWFPSPITTLVEFLLYTNLSVKRLPWLFPYHRPTSNGYVEFIPGCCMLLRQSDLSNIGSFDERFFMYSEDMDLCKRVRNAGKKVYYLADISIVHLCGASSSTVVKKTPIITYYHSRYKLICKHQGKISGMLFRGFVLIGAIIRLAISLILYGGNISHKTCKKYLYITSWSVGIERV